MKFDAYYDKRRFRRYDELWLGYFAKYKGASKIKKTACFYNEKINFYIDSSDGVNEDLNINEDGWRICEIIKECDGKPFVMFKTSYSEVHSKAIKDLAEQNNGTVVPYFLWSYYDEFDRLLRDIEQFDKVKHDTKKIFDIGFVAKLKPYQYPKSHGRGVHIINTRQEMFDKLKDSRFSFSFHESLPFDEYIKHMFQCKVSINVAGIGEYTGRMLEGLVTGSAVVIRKNSYDNCISYKNYFPEIDFNANDWEDKLQNVVDNYVFWERRARQYWEMVYANPLNQVDYMLAVVRQKI